MHIQCPEFWKPENLEECSDTLFLGGGITGTQEWQIPFVEYLNGYDLTIFNPRRNNFDVNDPNATKFQIEWEFYHLRFARMRMFWFPSETLCPITLFELGKYCSSTDLLFVGCHPEYKRKVDVEVQLRLARPNDAKVYSSLDELGAAIIHNLP